MTGARAMVSGSVLSHDRMWEAFIERDSDFEGVFVTAVKTTGIFCRPTCSARKPLRSNVEFFPSAREAIAAGYRACKRCTPMAPAPTTQSELVRTLMERVRAQPSVRISDADLRREGLDPSTVRRQFNAAIGMTFQAWQRAERLGRAFLLLRSGTSAPLPAAGDAGYESLSGFSEAFTNLFGVSPGQTDVTAQLYASWLDTPLGPMVCVAHDDGIVLLEFCDRRALETEIHDLRRRCDSVVVPARHALHDQLASELEAYFDGASMEFRTPLLLLGSAFQRATWEQLQAIEPGTTRTYAEQARALGRPKAARAVGRANGENRIAIVVPCHRVIGADGSLVGYAGGLWRKRWLLHHEAAHASASAT